ncbi:unnamed protein product [Callosobruchus maculatus]|uniref:START domain-containing protein n=1 Tax=Callosobruchus maculatus TaxID=64391 RepID=A0A653BNZ6_CALMS|nr:unnamed protein product [Callosobruchus maculatus]
MSTPISPIIDFVNLRHWDLVEGRYVISHVKTDHPSLPINKKIVRGESAVGCTIIEQTDDPNKCTLYWIVNVDLKMWLPRGIFDKEMSQMMFSNNFMLNV